MKTRVAAVAAAFAVAACMRNPVTGHQELALVSTEQEIQLGKQSAQQVTEQIGRYPDEKLQAYVGEIGMKMAKASERPDLPWTFTVIDDPSVNAFALPGGPVFVTRGLLTYLNSDAQLAAVVGHETGHITARHSVQDISKEQLAQLGLGIGSIFSDTLRQAGQFAGAGLQLLFLRFSRDHERQADELGFKYMTQQSYDPREMAQVFRTLDRQSKQAGGGRLPQWLSTHPDPGNRVEIAKERAEKVPNADRMHVDREGYLARLAGTVFGENPRQGFFKGNSFLHPDLKLKMDFPDGWQKQNTPGAVVAVSPQKDAQIELGAVGKTSPQDAAKKFFSQQGIRPLALTGGGFPGTASGFEAQTEQGALRGVVSFLSHSGVTLALVGYTPAQRFDAYAPVFQRSFASFGPLTDPAALNVQPARIELVKVPREMTVQDFNAQFPSTVPVEAVAIINGLDGKDAKLEAGRTAKRVVGGEVPKS